MAIIVRFMSSKELNEFESGKRLYSDQRYMGLSNSIGFCFFPEVIKTDYFTIDGEDMESYLENNYNYMVIFKVKDPSGFKKGTGRYQIRNRIVSVKEYSTTSYSNKELEIVEKRKV
jgi:hypothetical protein